MVRAKFTCTNKTDGNPATITLQPVTSGSQENDKFFAATPGGQVELSVVNEDAARQFEVGGDYYLDFSRVGEKPAGKRASKRSKAPSRKK